MSNIEILKVDECIATWQQGDVILCEDIPFIYLVDLKAPLTAAAKKLVWDEEQPSLEQVAVDIIGLVILSQTCDLVRDSSKRPFVEVCALVKLPPNEATNARKGKIFRYALLPSFKDGTYAADLDRIMTVEKSLLASRTIQYHKALLTDAECRAFSEALIRRLTRAAFPNDFVEAISAFKQHIISCYKNDNPEGEFLKAISQIRIVPKPDWNANEIEVDFYFVFDKETNIPENSDVFIEGLLKKIKIDDKIIDVSGYASAFNSMTAEMYLMSHQLELDYLSTGI